LVEIKDDEERRTNKEEYKVTRREAKLAVMKAKTINLKSLYAASAEKDGDSKLCSLSKARKQRDHDFDQVKCINLL